MINNKELKNFFNRHKLSRAIVLYLIFFLIILALAIFILGEYNAGKALIPMLSNLIEILILSGIISFILKITNKKLSLSKIIFLASSISFLFICYEVYHEIKMYNLSIDILNNSNLDLSPGSSDLITWTFAYYKAGTQSLLSYISGYLVYGSGLGTLILNSVFLISLTKSFERGDAIQQNIKSIIKAFLPIVVYLIATLILNLLFPNHMRETAALMAVLWIMYLNYLLWKYIVSKRTQSSKNRSSSTKKEISNEAKKEAELEKIKDAINNKKSSSIRIKKKYLIIGVIVTMITCTPIIGGLWQQDIFSIRSTINSNTNQERENKISYEDYKNDDSICKNLEPKITDSRVSSNNEILNVFYSVEYKTCIAVVIDNNAKWIGYDGEDKKYDQYSKNFFFVDAIEGKILSKYDNQSISDLNSDLNSQSNGYIDTTISETKYEDPRSILERKIACNGFETWFKDELKKDDLTEYVGDLYLDNWFLQSTNITLQGSSFSELTNSCYALMRVDSVYSQSYERSVYEGFNKYDSRKANVSYHAIYDISNEKLVIVERTDRDSIKKVDEKIEELGLSDLF